MAPERRHPADRCVSTDEPRGGRPLEAQREAPTAPRPQERDERLGTSDLLLEAVTHALLAIVRTIDTFRGKDRPRFAARRARRP